MQKRWVLKPGGEPEKVASLAAALDVVPALAELLLQRDVNTFAEARAFFKPELGDLHDPFLMKDMDKAVGRVIHAIEKNEKILVYGDYDVDGTTAVALVYTFLKEELKHSQIDFYIPDRYDEGYGISFQSVDYARDNGFGLVIALDCGIKAIDKVAQGNEIGVDFIICDHHRPGEFLPDAVAVLDAKRLDCLYPFKELSGCGVGFKLIQALAITKGIEFEVIEKFLDLVVVSIASDLVPITGENRILAFHGLKILNQNPRPGFEAILKFSDVNRRTVKSDSNIENVSDFNKVSNLNNSFFSRELTISDLVFLLGPRINAAGRIEKGNNSVELLICKDIKTAEEKSQKINEFNNTRRGLDATATKEALDQISKDNSSKNANSTIVYNENWHKGVIGIVASRLIESFYRPTIVLTKSNGLITGSARSIKDFDIYDAIDECSSYLKHFGGHKYAAGLSMEENEFENFKREFDKIASRKITEKMKTPEIEVDLKIELNIINHDFLDGLKQFAPFGPENMSPIFRTDNVKDSGIGKIVGKNHLKLTIGHPEIASSPFPAIAFQQGDHFSYISSGQPFDICYHIEENEWNGKKDIQLNIKDIKIDPAE